MYHKKTYTGLLLNYFSFTPYVYKIGLIQTLIDRIFKINNTWTGFDKDIKKLSNVLEKNQYPLKVIESEVKNYVNKLYGSTKSKNNESEITESRYFKLPYIGHYSTFTKTKVSKLIKTYCKDISIKLVFTNSKLINSFSLKDPIPECLKSSVVYRFKCASCNASYIGETSRHLVTRINEHLHKDKNSHIYKHLKSSNDCEERNSAASFSILDSATTKHQLRIKEGLHIGWEKPTLNKQVNHFQVSITV